ncbi:hypothetical protein MO867_09115 [Microbulbifer sp. OS29]|uniref:Uncharacterized protein n=1 Tax=Microbulbifer okhotskensis TaxID=2926617 RepID=A0A9X2J6D8_9GAMM|nr:hypothetical protein [Microbulbifer okhotskensis]MCO1334500.1 hypothetical protein [Microbulbifer okhotskensis]
MEFQVERGNGMRRLRLGVYKLRVIQLVCSLFVFSLLWGWTTTNTVVTYVWHSPYINSQNLGKTLVLAYTLIPQPLQGVSVEREWVSQLQESGIDAHSWSALAPMIGIPSMREITRVLKGGGFDTLLVTQLLALKQTDPHTRNASVAIVETRLYIAPDDDVYWSVQSETFLYRYSGQELRHPSRRDLYQFVQTMMRTMAGSGVL